MDHYTPFNAKNGSKISSRNSAAVAPPAPIEVPQKPAAEDTESRLEYLRNMMPPLKSRRRWPAVLLFALVGIVVIGGVGYFFDMNHQPKQPKLSLPTHEPKAQAVVNTLAHYVSNGNDLNLDFNYPSNWNVTPSSNNNPNDQTITLNSSLAKIENGDGASVTGKVTVTIRPASDSLNELSSGTATAAQPSAQFAYAQPTSDQFQYPYMAFIDLIPGSNPSSTFQEVLISGNTAFSPGQGITAANISVDPIIAANFYSCATTNCTGSAATPIGITMNTWQNNTVCKQVLALFESLQFN